MTNASSCRPVGITQRDVVEAALAIVRSNGVQRLSMRELARSLGVQAATLYHHVRDKAALLDLISAEAFRSLERPDGAYDDVASLDEWSLVLRDDVVRLRCLYSDYPGLARAVIEHGQMEDVSAADTSFEPPELMALVRLGVPRQQGLQAIEAAARWTMAALAAEPVSANGDLGERLFNDGLSLLLLGMVTHLAGSSPGCLAAVPWGGDFDDAVIIVD